MKKWIAKRFLTSQVNSLLKLKEGNIQKNKKVVEVWIGRVEKILSFLKSMLKMLDDFQIDENEVDQMVGELKETIKTW